MSRAQWPGARALVAFALHDPSAWTLLASNLATIFFALTQHWSLVAVMWVYWVQSVIIGIFTFVRLLTLENYSTEGFTVNNLPVEATHVTKFGVAGFFALHYGLFHLVYAIFLVTFGAIGWLGDEPGAVFGSTFSLAAFALTCSGFFVNHLYSFVHNRERDSRGQNIGDVMSAPYARILPMQLTIILGAFLQGAGLPFFLVLKTGADLAMHARGHEKAQALEAAR